MRRPSRLLAPLALALAVSGCGPSGNTVWVTGKLLKNGAKYSVPEGQKLAIVLVATEVQDAAGKTVASTEPYAAEFVPADGTFTVPGPDRAGIPPGKYRVSVVQTWRREALDEINKKSKKKPVDRETDTLGNRFGLNSSPILREIKGPTDLVVDLERVDG